MRQRKTAILTWLPFTEYKIFPKYTDFFLFRIFNWLSQSQKLIYRDEPNIFLQVPSRHIQNPLSSSNILNETKLLRPNQNFRPLLFFEKKRSANLIELYKIFPENIFLFYRNFWSTRTARKINKSRWT